MLYYSHRGLVYYWGEDTEEGDLENGKSRFRQNPVAKFSCNWATYLSAVLLQ